MHRKQGTYWPDGMRLWGGVLAFGLGAFILTGALLARAPRLFFVAPLVGAAVGYSRHQRRLPGAGLPPELAERVRIVAAREQRIHQQLRRLGEAPAWADSVHRLVANHHLTAIQLAESEALLASEPPSALAIAEAEYQASLVAVPEAGEDFRRRGAALEARREARKELVELTVRTSLRLGLLEDTLAVMATGAATANEPSVQLQVALHEAEAAMNEASADLAGQKEVRALSTSGLRQARERATAEVLAAADEAKALPPARTKDGPSA